MPDSDLGKIRKINPILTWEFPDGSYNRTVPQTTATAKRDPRQGRETMTTNHAKTVLAQMIAIANEYDRLDDVVMRQQMIRNAMDLPLGLDFIKAALRDAGLPTR